MIHRNAKSLTYRQAKHFVKLSWSLSKQAPSKDLVKGKPIKTLSWPLKPLSARSGWLPCLVTGL
jgi:hypothetical protein